MIKKILFSILLITSFPVFAAEPLSPIFESLMALSKRLDMISAEKSELKTLTIEESLQKIASEEQRLKAILKELEGLKQHYAADLQGDEKPQKMGRKATEDLLADIEKVEKDIAQKTALSAASGVVRTTLEEMKKQNAIMDYSIETWNEWSLQLKGIFKNYPVGAYPLTEVIEEQKLEARARGITVEYLDKEKRMVVRVEMIASSTVQTFAELKVLLKTGMSTDGVKKILLEKGANVNMAKGDRNEYSYSWIVVAQARFATKTAE